MSKRTRNGQIGFTAVEAVVVLCVIAVLSIGGWYVWHNNQKSSSNGNSITQQNDTQDAAESEKTTDPSEGGKYLVIKEWGVKVLLPQDLQGKVSYTLDEALDTDSGLQIQAVKIRILASLFEPGVCGEDPTINSGSQYVRSDNSKPFNASRYKGTTKASILSVGSYDFHLNYTTPDCADDGHTIQSLESALIELKKIDN